MKLTPSNYHSLKANEQFWSVSQYKAFQTCPAAAMAELTGEYERPTSEAFLQGGYVDAHFSGTLPEYLVEHPEILNKRTGELKAAYTKARAAIERGESDALFSEYMGGETQRIFTGELFGKPWKCKVDVLHDDKIVDLKYMKDMDPIWKDGEWQPFVQAYGYDIQGFVYQQIVEQVTGKHLPFYLAVITKEDPADIALIHVPDKFLNVCRGSIEHYLPIYDDIKQGKAGPARCEKCAWCRQSKKLTVPLEYEDLLNNE